MISTSSFGDYKLQNDGLDITTDERFAKEVVPNLIKEFETIIINIGLFTKEGEAIFLKKSKKHGFSLTLLSDLRENFDKKIIDVMRMYQFHTVFGEMEEEYPVN